MASRIPLVIGVHLLVSAAAEAAFVWRVGHHPRVVLSHLLLVAEWDVSLAAIAAALVAFSRTGARWPRLTYRSLMAVTGTVQVYLYTLNVVSNSAWGRNITAHLVYAFAPTIWYGKEPFPVGAAGITAFACATFAVIAAVLWSCRRAIDEGLESWRGQRVALLAIGAAMALVFAATLRWGIRDRDDLLWTQELIASFFRPDAFAFAPSARREAAVARDAVVRAAYHPQLSRVHRKHVILIIVDSLRADRMQLYGYPRPTTPFLSQLARSGRLKKVESAFSTCSESFCGITSTLSGREFRDISAREFQLQDVLHDEGYQTWFLLSGNHRAWNGLPQFYHASDDRLFDGTQTQRYTMDDDRLVLEGLERVPPASPATPTFFYIHLMSTHYLGVEFPESHVFTRPQDDVSPGSQPFQIADQLNNPDRYDDKVRQADGVIHQLFDALAAKHYLDDAIVVVTGDHGEGLGERHWAHGWELYNEDIHIPMLFYDVPAATYPDLAFATQVDIAPTILDRLGLPIPASWEGQSLLAPTPRRFTYHQTYFLPNRFAVLYRDGRDLFKFIATPQYGKEELYDLTRDRHETHNLATERPALADLLRDKLRAYRPDEP